MRRCLVHHPRRYAGARPVRLRNDDELDAAIGESPDYQYGLAAPGMERIVDPPLDRVFVGSLSLFRRDRVRAAMVFALSGGFCRFHQAATAGSLKIGSSLSGAIVSRSCSRSFSGVR